MDILYAEIYLHPFTRISIKTLTNIRLINGLSIFYVNRTNNNRLMWLIKNIPYFRYEYRGIKMFKLVLPCTLLSFFVFWGSLWRVTRVKIIYNLVLYRKAIKNNYIWPFVRLIWCSIKHFRFDHIFIDYLEIGKCGVVKLYQLVVYVLLLNSANYFGHLIK